MATRRYQITVESTVERLYEAGPLIPGAWSRHDDSLGRQVQGQFLLDTGAFGAMIDLEVAQSLQLPSQGSREVHGIHGYGSLRQFLGRISLPALDAEGSRTVFTTVIECVGVPSLRDKSREQGADVVGILGRMFLRRALLRIDGLKGSIEIEITSQASKA